MNVTVDIVHQLDLSHRLMNINWEDTIKQLNTFGYVHLSQILTANECDSLVALYPRNELFRTHIHMARHNFGKGEYEYFSYPLPNVIAELRTTLFLYAQLVPYASRR
ncbi:hypothetical protein [Xenorhabdus entomophaga]|uniref:hypothetical protein n=1 Tax=Xenorhabdus entomophaga TaxID=3136257 RepID=UPI0030F48631